MTHNEPSLSVLTRHIAGAAPAHALRRVFVAVQGAKAVLGIVLSSLFVAVTGTPDLAAILAIAGLVAPGALMLLGVTRIALPRLETAGLCLSAALIGYMALFTGGLASPLMIWLLLVPAEAALAGGRGLVLRAGLAAIAALGFVALVQALGQLPLSRLPVSHPSGGGWMIPAMSFLAALAQAALIAAAAQDRQRAADEAAAEGAAMYRFLADNAMDLITRHGPDGRVRFASPSSFALLGYAPDEILGLAPAALVHADDAPALIAAFTESAWHGRPAGAELRFRRRDNGFVWAEIRCRPTAHRPGEAADVVAVTRDITARKATERALIEARDAAEEASRAKSRFLANMSHELRTPLNAIIGFSEVMTHQMFGPLGDPNMGGPRYLEYARLVHESGGHLLELINGILDMSKIEAGKFDLSEEIFDLTDAADAALRFLKLPAERAGVSLTTHIDPSAARIFADKRAIKQVLVNLLSNGVKFTPRGGAVHVEAVREGAGVRITVRDTGMGISPRDIERLGKPFEQVEGEMVRSKEGTGLGLALVKAFARMHGGDAVLTSVLGTGTEVTVTLPHAAVQDEAQQAAPSNVVALKGAA